MRTFAIAGLILLAGLFACFPGAGGRAGGESRPITTLEGRREALVRQAGLEEKEKELVAELLAWDVKIDAARREQERLRQEIPAAERSLAGAEAGLAEARARLEEGRDRLGRWVNFLYRYGWVTYLEVVLGAASFGEFVERAQAVMIVIANQAKMLDEVRELTARLQEQVDACERARRELAEKGARLEASLNEMAAARAGREEFLAGLRRESAALAEKIVQAEVFWYRSLSSFNSLLSSLDVFPWRDLSPEKITVKGSKVQVEISENEINRVLLDNGGAGLNVQISPGLFAISGPASGGSPDFRIEGDFAAEDGKVRFRPAGVYLDGVPVSREVLAFVSSESRLALDPQVYLPGCRLSEVRAEAGRLVLLMALK